MYRLLGGVFALGFRLWDLIGRPRNRFARALWAVLAAVLVFETITMVADIGGILFSSYDSSEYSSLDDAALDDLATDGSFDDLEEYEADLGDIPGDAYLIFLVLLGYGFSVLASWLVLGGLATVIETLDEIRHRLRAAGIGWPPEPEAADPELPDPPPQT